MSFITTALKIGARENPALFLLAQEIEREERLLRRWNQMIAADISNIIGGVRAFQRSVHFEVRGTSAFAYKLASADRSFNRDLGKALRQAAQPVRADAAAAAEERWGHRTAAGYRVRGGVRSVNVGQSLRKTTGHHPEFGGLQLRQALEPALAHNEANIVRAVERAVDKTLRSHGLK